MGSNMAKMLRTYYMDAPLLDKIWQALIIKLDVSIP